MKAAAEVLLLSGLLSVTHGWSCREGPQKFPAAQLDAGQGKVVMTDGLNNVYFLHQWSWYKLGTLALKHVSVGPAGIWGVDASEKVYKYVAGDFILSDGETLQQVDVGGGGQVVGVSSSSTVHCLRGGQASGYRQAGTLRWNSLPGALLYISCGPRVCWGVTSDQQIYVTTMNAASCEFSGWEQIPGAAKMVEVSSGGGVFAVHPEGTVFQRVGMSPVTPQGTDWVQVPICLLVKHLSADQGFLWVVSNGGVILRCSP